MKNTLIFRDKDPWGPVEVFETKTLLNLHFGNNIIQSSMYLDDPYALEMEYNRVMMLPLMFNPSPRNVLFLGLGGGSKPKFLWKYFSCHIDVVERSQLVIDIGHRYFHVPVDPQFRIFCEDADVFLQNAAPEPLYDFIFIDLYLPDRMSDVIEKNNFFFNCRKLLKENGIVIWNLWQSVPRELVEPMMGNLEKAIGNRKLILTNEESPNEVVIAFTNESSIHSSTLPSAAEQLQRQTGMDFPSLLRNFENCRKSEEDLAFVLNYRI